MRFACMICGWEGTESELISRDLPRTTGPADGIIENSCPQCGNKLGLQWVWDNMASGLDRGGTVAHTGG